MVTNMKAIIIYKSSTGFTKKYAGWIAQELSCKAVSAENAKTLDLNDYDAVIFGGWFFAGSIHGFKEYREKLQKFKGKKAIFVVGAMPADTTEATKALRACFTDEERKTTGTFYMQGGLDYSHMKPIHRMMMKAVSMMLKKQKGVGSTQYKTVSVSFDATDKTAIKPLVNYIAT